MGGPVDDCESGDPGVSATISAGSSGDGAGEVDNRASADKVWSRSVGEVSCGSAGVDGSSLVTEEIVEPEGEEERFEELERLR